MPELQAARSEIAKPPQVVISGVDVSYERSWSREADLLRATVATSADDP